MKQIKFIGFAFAVLFLGACKTEPKPDVLTDGEVMQSTEGLRQEAEIIDQTLHKAADSLVQDIKSAESSVKETVEDIKVENTQLKENINNSIEQAEKK